MKRSSVYDTLNKRQQKFSATSVPMYKINQAIKVMEKMMMENDTFKLLATTLSEEKQCNCS